MSGERLSEERLEILDSMARDESHGSAPVPRKTLGALIAEARRARRLEAALRTILDGRFPFMPTEGVPQTVESLRFMIEAALAEHEEAE